MSYVFERYYILLVSALHLFLEFLLNASHLLGSDIVDSCHVLVAAVNPCTLDDATILQVYLTLSLHLVLLELTDEKLAILPLVITLTAFRVGVVFTTHYAVNGF